LDEIYHLFGSSEEGLSRSSRRIQREQAELNLIPPPVSCPAWLCCILPCILHTDAMKTFNECIPQYSEVKMNREWVKIDPIGILVGDIVRIKAGTRVPADMRIISVYLQYED
jgi:hypothetical protein